MDNAGDNVDIQHYGNISNDWFSSNNDWVVITIG